MEQALIEMAKQIAKLQAENEKLKSSVKDSSKRKSKSRKIIDEREERARHWAAQQYERLWNEALEKNKDRIAAIRVHNPTFMPINDCMDSYGK